MKNLYILLVALFVYTFSNAQWTQIGQDIDGEANGDRSGSCLSLSSEGNVVAIGAPFNDGNSTYSGQVRIYENINGTWIQIGQDIDGEEALDGLGTSVSLNSEGNIVAIGAPYNDGNGNDSGHVQVYENINGTWIQIGQDIDGEVMGDESGHSISLSSIGNKIAISAKWNDGSANNSGHVRVYENINNDWIQIGQDIDGENEGDSSGFSLSINSEGTVVAIGAILNDGNNGNTNSAGHVRIYEINNGNWVQIGQDLDGEEEHDFFGASICLNSAGTIIAISAPLYDGNNSTDGLIRVFENINGIWTQMGQDIFGEAVIDESGTSISLNSVGNVLAIGASNNDGNGVDSGHVRVYKYSNNLWTQVSLDIDGENEEDKSGWWVSLNFDGSLLAIGAPLNDDNGLSAGHVRVYENLILGIEDSKISVWNLYPNPTQDVLNIESQLPIETVKIYSLQGQLIEEDTTSSINVSQLTTGLYFVQVTIEGKTITKKFLKE